jgi:kynurenine 3-monooxygenase
MKNITIVGAGLVGSLHAIYMAKRGYNVKVFERRSDLRKADISAGKSINLVISHRGWTALKKAGIADQIEGITIPAHSRMTHDTESNTKVLPYSIKNEPIHSVSRGGLNAKLMDIADVFENVEFFFNEKCLDIDLKSNTAHFENSSTNEKKTISSDLIVGSDGAFSSVRNRLTKTDRFNYSQQFIEHGYKELVIPPNKDGSPQITQDSLHIWPRKSFMLMALANLDGGFTCTLFMPFEGINSFDAIKDEKDLIDFFEKEFPDAIPLMPTLKEDYFNNKTSSLAIVKCNPWHHKGNVALIGDAAHAIIPFYGEGMNCGLEDCYVFDNLLDELGDDNMEELLSQYSKSRQPNADAIADLSVRNFVEMRDLVADSNFILRKKIEGKVYANNPEKWVPLYSQVKFTNTEYHVAKASGEKHDAIMKEIMQLPNIEENWDSSQVELKILSML